MDLSVASGFKPKPAFLPGEASELPDRSPLVDPQTEGPLSPGPDQPSPPAAASVDSTFPFDHVNELDGTAISSTSPPSSPLPKDTKQPREMYDPFSPTDGEKEERAGGEEEVAEKYDPFEPTGSPASDHDMSTEDLKNQVEEVQNDESTKMEEGVEEPPDSTDALVDSPKRSPGLLTLRRTVDCSTIKEEHTDSEHSEIEEGEIVGLADREAGLKRPIVESLSVNSPSSTFFSSKPERILRVLDGDGFVSVRADPDWPVNREHEEEPVVGVEDLRRKLVSRRKERYITFPGSSITLTTETTPPSGHLHSPPPTPPQAPLDEEDGKTRKSSKSSNDRDRQKSKDRKSGAKEEKRKKRRKEKRSAHKSKDGAKDDLKSTKEAKSKGSSRSRSSKRKKRQHGSPDPAGVERTSRVSPERSRDRPRDASRHRDRDRDRDRDHSRDKNRELDRSRDRNSERSRDRHRERSRERTRGDRERSKDRGDKERSRDRDRYWDRHRDRDRDHRDRRSQRTDEGDSRGSRKRAHESRSRERDGSKRSRRSSEKNEGDRERHRDRDRERDRERRRDGRPVVPPSIQDLNGSDLFAIKRTITVTTTTTTTTVPGSPRLAPGSPSRSPLDMDKSHRKKKRKGRSSPEDRGHPSRSRSLSPPRYHNYESDRYSDKLDIDVLSLDGEALDSDYPSLEDTPPPAPPPPLPSPKAKPTSKTGQLKRKSLKKNSESSRTKNKALTGSAASDITPVSSGLPVVKRTRKVKDKTRDKGSRKELSRSGKSKKDGTTSRKGKLQSKVSVLVREGVSSTTGSSGKLGMDLLGSGGPGSGAGGSVVGGSIAVVFCRDNESRSPFLKPCSEPLSLGGRGKDLSSIGKRSSLAAPPSSMSSPATIPSQKAKPGSITSTSSSASSPSSSLVTKRRRRLVKKTREKGGAGGSKAEEGAQGAASAWVGASTEPLATSGEVCKAASPHPGPAGSAPCSSSSSSSSTSVLPPSSSPPPSPPPSAAPMRDMRESSPDSQTVDSSCKTPEPSFLVEECPSQTSPTTPPSSSPSIMPTSLGTGLSLTPTDPPKPCSPPPCPSSSAVCGLSSLSLDPSSSSVSSSSTNKPPPPPPPPTAPALPWSLQTGVDCTAGGVLALTALLFKMEEANIASRAKAQEFIQATSQILSQANQSQPTASASSQVPPAPSLPPPSRVSPGQFILHNSSHLHPCAQTPPPVGLSGLSGSAGDSGWDNDNKDPDKYLKKLHTQERAVEEVKLAIKPYYQRKDINKDEYKDILRKAVHKICHSRTGEINPVKVSNLVKLYVQRYKYFRKHGRKMDGDDREDREPGGLHSSA
ncbi:splicing factor, arginine/serine-rich 19 [Boleophthalmus pectinirostris]|uniref:splicing factor, arginine/serine-rich 19 n=1 Tax=Boleophthalmus pectinirostris TaxID=150288 RepID=UPI0024332191|nr:splicing factor, arginine/serine-rich 19 [Boleophthalmus pectinirostris]XP_055008341.1 splicing factor, arginine/serine-rich 19 [Boleophthalmus pectinirostris]